MTIVNMPTWNAVPEVLPMHKT